ADVNARDEDGNTALIEASSRWGNAAIVNVLLSAGAYMNAKDKYGETALIRASYLGRTDSVKALLSAGADVNAKDENGETVLMVARRLGYKDIADIIGTAIKRARRRANISRLNFRRICTFCLEKTFGFKHRPDTVEALSEENAELHEEVRELVKQVCQLGTLLDRENEGKPRKVCRWRIPNRGLAIPGCHFVYSPLCIPESLQAWQFCPLCGEAIQKIEEDK
ncbi:MAG: ankyrin repeat domain-containing protein, partial [Candidatus Micrarchaeia archaeon]